MRFFFVALVLAGCAGPVTAQGSIVSCADLKPLEGAKITIRDHDRMKVSETLGTALPPPQDTATTDATGHFGPTVFHDVKESSYTTVIVEKEGYTTTSSSYPNWPKSLPVVCLELKKAPPPPPPRPER
jgi:hypothetical protein